MWTLLGGLEMIEKIQAFDLYLFQKLNQKTFPKWLDHLMIFMSYIGNCGYFWLFVTAYFYYGAPPRQEGIKLFLVLIFATLLGQVMIKPVVKRKRPCHSHDIPLKIKMPKDYSFPSGHTMSSFACVFIILNYNPVLGILSLLVGLGIAVSRIYLNVHYFSDVFCGALLGLFVGWCLTLWF